MQPFTRKKKGGDYTMKASEVLQRLSSGEMIPLLRGIYSENIDEQVLRYGSVTTNG